MADTFTNATGGAGALGAFIPEIWANSALEVLRNQIVAARLITKDTDITGSFTVGDVLNIPVPGTFTTNPKAKGTAVTLQNPSAGTVNVTLDQHHEVSFLVEDPVRAQQNQDTVAGHTRQAAVAIAEKIETDVLSLVSGFSTNVGNPATAPTNATLLAARQQLNTNKAPMDGRFIIVGPAGEVDLLGDTNLQTYFANSKPDGISNGMIGSAYGADIYMSQLVPSSGAGASGIAGTPEFGILAMRALPTAEAPGVSQMVMMDPVSGLAIRQTASYSADYLGVQITLDVLYGFAELRDACGVAFHHAKT